MLSAVDLIKLTEQRLQEVRFTDEADDKVTLIREATVFIMEAETRLLLDSIAAEKRIERMKLVRSIYPPPPASIARAILDGADPSQFGLAFGAVQPTPAEAIPSDR